jgi:predicted esterase
MGNSNVTDVVTQDAKREKPLVLCLHGWRTSGRILSMQTAALRYHTDIECKFIDAPFEASGPPDQGIATFYSNEDYCEWYTTNSTNYHACLLHSLSVLIKYINENGPFDAVLGFSQGAAMATRLALLQQENDHRLNRSCYFKYLVLIGGVIPKELNDSVS